MTMKKVILFSTLMLISDIQLLQAQDGVLSPTKILKLVPDQIKGFQQLDDPKAMKMKVGTITYTLCEKHFNDGKRSIKILLFDFNEAAIMYKQATQKWSNQPFIESDTIVERSMMIKNCTGWESFYKQYKTSQLFLGICDRFFLTVSGENVELDELKKILDQFPLDEFPN